MFFSELEKIAKGKVLQLHRDTGIQNLVIDSRKAIVGEGSVFFAISGPRNDGHQYISDLYHKGIRQFIVQKIIDLKIFPEANVLLVDSSIDALQSIARAHRSHFSFPVIGVTGSNGKTIVKEWLYQLLSPDNTIVKNPGSYNSQIGVPLSVWAMQSFHQLGIFEAGVSMPGEMGKLEKVIMPTIGVFTNIGTAHDEGFENIQQKINEKLKLFANVKVLIYCSDHFEIDQAVRQAGIPSLSWGRTESAGIKLTGDSVVEVNYQIKSFKLSFPFADKASL